MVTSASIVWIRYRRAAVIGPSQPPRGSSGQENDRVSSSSFKGGFAKILAVNNFWKEKTELPEGLKTELGELASGEPVFSFQIGNRRAALLKVDHRAFRKAFDLNRPYLFHGEFTAKGEDNDYSNADTYLLEGGLAGFAVSPDGWAYSLFSNERGGFLKGVAPFFKKKSNKLCCLCGEHNDRLARAYSDLLGYVLAAETADDEARMRTYYDDEFVDYFVEMNGKPRHLFFVAPPLKEKTKTVASYYDGVDFISSLYPLES